MLFLFASALKNACLPFVLFVKGELKEASVSEYLNSIVLFGVKTVRLTYSHAGGAFDSHKL